MRFRMTIMPRANTGNAKEQTGAVPSFGGGRTSGFVAGNTMPKLGNIPDLGGLSSLAGGKEGIIISPDEISSVNFNISDFSVNQTSNLEANVTVKLLGKLLSHVEENEAGLPLSMNSLLTNFAGAGVSELTSGLSKGMQILGSSFAGGLTNTLTGMLGKLGGKSIGLGNLYEKNIENTKELAKWALSYGENSDYRDIVLELIITEGVTKTYILPDMYAVDYDEILNVKTGEGSFTVELKQKRFSERKIQID